MNTKMIAELVPDAHIQTHFDFDGFGLPNSDRSDRRVGFFSDERYIEDIISARFCAVVTTRSLAKLIDKRCATIVVENPQEVFFMLHNTMAPTSIVYEDTTIADNAEVSPGAFIDSVGVKIGEGSIVEPGTTVSRGSLLGDHVIIRAGASIGASGFEFKKHNDRLIGVVHDGKVILYDNVEIGPNATVIKGLLGRDTIVGSSSKVDAGVHVAHGVHIGKRCMIAANVTISGSVVVGDDVWIGPNATIRNGLHIGDQAFLSIGSVVIRSVKDGERVFGNPARRMPD